MQKFFLHLFILVSVMLTNTYANPDPLRSFRWDYRIILLSASPERADELVSELKEAEAAIEERHILWFVLDGQSVVTNHTQQLTKNFQTSVLRSYFKDSAGGIQLRLIGKDGGVKEKSGKLDLERIFAVIDSMPMRQAEMRTN